MGSATPSFFRRALIAFTSFQTYLEGSGLRPRRRPLAKGEAGTRLGAARRTRRGALGERGAGFGLAPARFDAEGRSFGGLSEGGHQRRLRSGDRRRRTDRPSGLPRCPERTSEDRAGARGARGQPRHPGARFRRLRESTDRQCRRRSAVPRVRSVHRGWRVTEMDLPKTTGGHDLRILAAAEVEL
jgi:hypothetical protein